MKKLLIIPLTIIMVIGLILITDSTGEIVIKTDGGYIHGSILKPAVNPEGAIAILVAGSGPTDRNGNTPLLTGRSDSLKYLAYSLKENDIATFRFDQRSSGKSFDTFKNKNFMFDMFVDDLINCIRYIKENEKFKKIYLIGHSQGSLVAILAAQKEKVDGVISVAGAARPIENVLNEQIESQSSQDAAEKAKKGLEAIKEGREETSDLSGLSDEIKAIFKSENRAFLKQWMQYDPAQEVRKLDIPVLYIYGTSDLQLPPVEINYFGDIIKEDNSKIIENMNHELKVSPKDLKENQKRYNDPSYPIHPDLVNTISGFIIGGA